MNVSQCTGISARPSDDLQQLGAQNDMTRPAVVNCHSSSVAGGSPSRSSVPACGSNCSPTASGGYGPPSGSSIFPAAPVVDKVHATVLGGGIGVLRDAGQVGQERRPLSLADLEGGAPKLRHAQTLPSSALACHAIEAPPATPKREKETKTPSLHRWSTLPARGPQASQKLCEELRSARARTDSMRQDAARLATELQEETERSPAIAPPPLSAKRSQLETRSLSNEQSPLPELPTYAVPRRQMRLDEVNLPQSSRTPQRPKEDEDENWRPGIMEVWQPQKEACLPSENSSSFPDSLPSKQALQASILAAPAGCQAGKLRVHVGTLLFDSFGGLGASGLFETSGFRVLLQLGSRPPMLWSPSVPATERSELKYSKTVSDDGKYAASLRCEFHEDIEVPVPEGSSPELLCADVWMERRTVIEQFDSILDYVGLGNNLPEFDRIFLARIATSIPPPGVEAFLQDYPVQMLEKSSDGPRPKAVSVGMEWMTE